MKYINADIILPEELLKEVQKYVQSKMVYIPKPEGLRKKWGENSGSRAYLKNRNEEIRRKFTEGASIDDLSSQYCLSCDSIKKIVYTKNNK